MFDSLQPHGPQQARLPCPSPTPGAYSNSCPWTRWFHWTILSSVVSFSSCLLTFPASGSFPMNRFFTSAGQSIRISALALVLPMAQMVKHLSAMQQPWVRSLGWEEPLEKEIAAHSSILAWKIPWTAEPGRLPSMGWQRVRHNWVTSLSLHPSPVRLSASEPSCGWAVVRARLNCTRCHLASEGR